MGFCLWHELAHIRNHDNLRKLLVHGVLCIHWFNPLVWVMYFLFNRDMELLCDELAIRRCRADKRDYALALLSMAQQRAAGFRTAPGFGKNAVKERILAVMSAKETRLGGMLAAIAAVGMALMVFFPVQGSESADVAVSEASVNVAMADTSIQDITYYTVTADVTGEREYPQATLAQEAADTVSGTQSTEAAYAEAAYGAEDTFYESTTDAAAAFSAAEAAADTGEVWEISAEAESAPESFITSVRRLGKEFEAYGLSVKINGSDYQLYYEGEPVYFFADNQSGDEASFSGRVFAKAAGRESGYTGVVTVRSKAGKITGLIRLSEEESEEFAGIWTGKRRR